MADAFEKGAQKLSHLLSITLLTLDPIILITDVIFTPLVFVNKVEIITAFNYSQ